MASHDYSRLDLLSLVGEKLHSVKSKSDDALHTRNSVSPGVQMMTRREIASLFYFHSYVHTVVDFATYRRISK